MYSSTIAITGWNADAFLWGFVGKFFAENGLNWKSLSSLFHGYFSPTLAQTPFQGLFSPLFTLMVFLSFKLTGSIRLLWYSSLLGYALSFPIMDRILKRVGFSLLTRWLVLISVFFSIYTLSLSFKIRPDNFAFLSALLSIYLSIYGKPIPSAILFAIAALGFKVQMALWGYFIAYFLIVRYGVRKFLRFIFTLGIFLVIYTPYYLWISGNLPNLSRHLSIYNLTLIYQAFDFIPAYSYVHLIGLMGLGILGLMYIVGWMPVSKFILHISSKMVPIPFPARSHMPNFLLDMGYGYLWEIGRNLKFKPARILMFLFLSFILFLHVSFGIKVLRADYIDTRIEDKFLKKIHEFSKNGRVCSIRSSRASFYIPVPYLTLFERSPNLDENPLWEPESKLAQERGCRYIAFIYYGPKPVHALGKKVDRKELVIIDVVGGNVVYRDKWVGKYPEMRFRFSYFAFVISFVLTTVLVWEVSRSIVPFRKGF